MKLKFDPRNNFYKKPFGAVAEHTAIAFCLGLEGENDFTSPGTTARLLIRRDESSWTCEIPGILEKCTPEDGDGNSLLFRFSLEAPEPGLYFYELQAFFPESKKTTGEYQLTVYDKGFQTPEWLAGGLMYQIFPDRFARSPQTPIPKQKKSHRVHEGWGELPDTGPDEKGIVWNNDFFGGNLKGIQEQLSYLEGLGVTVIYLNPIFRAFSNHRYDTADYMEIDPMLGTEQDFMDLCSAASLRGIRIILDGVFNHTGSHSVYFNRDGAFESVGACQSKDSPWYRWYTFQEYPDRYDCWWGIDTLPAVNEMEESYRDFISRGEDSVIRHWLRCGASGIRLDVADELPDVFLEEVRQSVRSVLSDGAVIGEVWEDASNKISYGSRRHYLQGHQLDSVMNYPLKDWIIDFLNNHGDGAILIDQLTTMAEHYPRPSFYTLMNILGTHDTERILTVLSKGTKSPQEARQKLFLALLIWAFVPGIPCLYYGDELGMEGGRDPLNRCCFQPDSADEEIQSFYRRLLRFRREIPQLGTMDYQPEPCDLNRFSFQRKGNHERILVFLNRSHRECRVELGLKKGERLLDFLNCGSLVFSHPFSSEGKNIVLGPTSGAVFRIIRKGD